MTRARRAVLSATLASLLGPIFGMILAQPVPADEVLLERALSDQFLADEPLSDRSVRHQSLPDKALHGIAGASAALLTAAVAAACVSESEPGAAAGAVAAAGLGSAALVGLAKELLDLTGAGDPDLVDFFSTVLGGAAAAAASYALVRAQAVSGDSARLSAPLASFGILLAVPVADAGFRSLRRTRGVRRAGNDACAVLP